MSPLRTLALLAVVGFCSSQTSDCSYLSLLKHLNLTPTTNDLLTIMRPVKNWTTTTLVQIDMVLYGILEVDEKSQTLTTHINNHMRWTNEFLTWDPSQFCGIDELTVPTSSLWIPDVNIVEDASDTGSVQDCLVVKVSSSGEVVAKRRQRLTSTCQLNLAIFPFDTQYCHFTFSALNSDVKSITLGTVYNDTLLTQVSEQAMVTRGEWTLNYMDIDNYVVLEGSEFRSKLTYTISISRKPMLYMINFIVPLMFFLILDLASFFIGEARGEKLSFKVTILLSISVLLLILKDLLPSTEDTLPMIATFCVVIFTLVGVSVLEAMLVGFLIDLDGCCGKKTRSSAEAPEQIQLEVDFVKEPAEAEETPEKSHLPRDRPDDLHLLKLILEEVAAARQEAEGRQKDARKTGRFRRLAEIIDSVFFTIYLITVVVFVVIMDQKWTYYLFFD